MSAFFSATVTVWLASLFTFTATSKLAVYRHSIRGVESYRLTSQRVSRTVGFLLPWLELTTVALLIVAPRIGGIAAAVLGVTFAAASASVLLRRLDASCGCSGGTRRPADVVTVLRAVAVVCAGAAIAVVAPMLPAAVWVPVVAASLVPSLTGLRRRMAHRRLNRELALRHEAEVAASVAILARPSPGPAEYRLPTLVEAG